MDEGFSELKESMENIKSTDGTDVLENFKTRLNGLSLEDLGN